MIEINPKELLAEIEAICVDPLYRDFVYTPNKRSERSKGDYAPTDPNPNGCLLGFAARRMGKSLDEFMGSLYKLRSSESIAFIPMDFDTSNQLRLIQIQQDKANKSWGKIFDSITGAGS